jgi:anti-sigma B factor antagonist
VNAALEALRAVVEALDVGAVVAAFPLAAAGPAWVGEHRTFVAVVFALVLALLVGLRLGWRAVASVSQRRVHVHRPDAVAARTGGDGATVDARGGSWSVPGSAGRHTSFGAAAAAPAPPAPPAPDDRPPTAQGGVRPADVLQALRSCMDEVSYTPGRPNVLSMTKFLDPSPAQVAAAPEGLERVDVGEETVLRVRGVLDAITAPALRPAFESVVAERRTSVEVDLSAVRLIDSSGVGVIVGLYKRCTAYGGRVRVRGLKDQPLAIFRLLHLDRIFPV